MPESVVPRRPIPSWAYRAGSVALYFFLTCLLYGFDLFNNSKIILQAGSDQAQEVWFLAWPAYAFTHLLNPFQSQWMNYPWGINLMTNTSMPLLGVLAMPITWLFGPVVTYTLLMRLAFVASAASVQFVARRIGVSRWASVIAGLIYGFSTIQIAQGYGHLFLVFAALPPLVFYSVFCLVVGRWGPRRSGITIGLLIAADFLISAERALMTVIVLVVVAVVSAVFASRLITVDLLKRIAWAVAWCIGVALVILVIPLLAMTGHAHVTGVAHPWIQSYETDLIAIFFPGPYNWFNPFGVVERYGLLVQAPENGAYLGIPLIGLFIFAVVRGWRTRLVRIGAVSTLIILGLSMGEVLKINGVKTSLHSPYKILTTIKYVENILPVRFMYFVWFGVALIAAFGLDQIVGSRRASTSRTGAVPVRVAAAAVVVGLIALTLVPGSGYPMVGTGVPPWFSTAEAARVIPANSVVLFYPYPQYNSNHGMLDQVVTGFHFKIIGGEAIVGDAHGNAVGIELLKPLELPLTFIRARECSASSASHNFECARPIPPLNARTVRKFHQFVVRHHVSTIVMEESYTPSGQVALRYLKAAFGEPLVRDGGLVLVWTGPMLDAAMAAR